MSFAETFSTLRKRRRLSTTAWEAHAHAPSPYIRDIEQKDLIPGREKLDKIASLFVEVAEDQGAADPEADARLLRRERERSFLIERAQFDPQFADLIVILYSLWREELEGEKREEALDAFRNAFNAFSHMDSHDREDFLDGLQQISKES